MKCIIIVLALFSVTFKAEAAPGAPRARTNCMFDGIAECELNSGPVCGVDASGITETFENKCMAYVVACQRDTFFVEVKPGEC